MTADEPLLRAPADSAFVYRLKTSYWHDGRSLHVKRSLSLLKRLSTVDFDPLAEDAVSVGAEEAAHMIINIDSCSDGIYKVVAVNESRDWESGMVEEWEYQLLPFDGEN